MTTPNLLTSYNVALDILLAGREANTSVLELQQQILQKVRHPAVRTWVNSLLSLEESIGAISEDTIKNKMAQFFSSDEDGYTTMHFIFNSKTGKAEGHFQYRRPTEQLHFVNMEYEDGATNEISIIVNNTNGLTYQERYARIQLLHWEGWCLDNEGILIVPNSNDQTSYAVAVQAFINTYNNKLAANETMEGIFVVYKQPKDASELLDATEDVGDMLRSNNIIIRERNYPTESGKIKSWEDTIEGKTYSHRIYHDLSVPLTNFQIQYRNMYL